jgi:hypothetical protein
MSKQSFILVYRVYSVSTLMWIYEGQYTTYRGLFATDYLCTLFTCNGVECQPQSIIR